MTYSVTRAVISNARVTRARQWGSEAAEPNGSSRRIARASALACALSAVLLAIPAARADGMPSGAVYTNSLGMVFVRIEPGEFIMGRPRQEAKDGKPDWDGDEQPPHKVTITRPFYICADLVKHEHYQHYQPRYFDRSVSLGWKQHPAVNVTWDEARAFCEWLSRKDGTPCRLPTEAEWEYACKLDQKQKPHKLRDMCGLMEQWCLDWYGPYVADDQIDPSGYITGTHRVVRGGSKLTGAESARPGKRASFLPADFYRGLGFRVVIGPPPTAPSLPPPVPLYQQHVSQERFDWKSAAKDPQKPFCKGPDVFVKIPPGSNGPLYPGHNHYPAITWCPNGDLLAVWYSDPGPLHTAERGIRLNVAASRLPRGSDQWQEASEFWVGAGRNDHAPALWTDPDTGRIYHFQGCGSYPPQHHQVLALRTSDDSGATWTSPVIINSFRTMWNPHVALKTREGHIVLTSDYNSGGPVYGCIILSKDGGKTWHAPRGLIIGQHPGIVQLRDGRLMAVGRDNWRNDHDECKGFGLPISTSSDWGETWQYRREPSLGGGIINGQRPVLITLREGAILYVGFTQRRCDQEKLDGIEVTDMEGKKRMVYGMFSALSFDDGKTWTHHKLLTLSGERRTCDGGGNTGEFFSDGTFSEPAGYIQAVQTPDGMIHLVSSRLHYQFNFAWLKQPTVALIDHGEKESKKD